MDNPTARPPEQPVAPAERLLLEHRHASRQGMTTVTRHATGTVEHAIAAARYCAMPIPANVEAAATALESWAESIYATLRREAAEREQTGMDGAQQQRQIEHEQDIAEGRAAAWFGNRTRT
jgi:hypothetical protein